MQAPSPAAGAPAIQPSLALAPGGSGIAAWHDGRSVANPEPRWRLPKGRLRLTVRRGARCTS